MAEPTDKPHGGQTYLPPPPETTEDSPGSVHPPRLEPPPASLDDWLPGRGTSWRGQQSWLLWCGVMFVIAVTAVAYYVGLRR